MRLLEEEAGRKVWEGYVSSDSALRGIKQPLMGAAPVPVVLEGKGLEKYVACECLLTLAVGGCLANAQVFPQLGFEKEALPSVELQYPAPGCTER